MTKTMKIITVVLIFLPLSISIVLFSYFILAQNQTAKLIIAIENENVEEIERILNNGVDANHTDIPVSHFWDLLETTPKRPLSIACKTGNLEIVKLLIKYGATAEDIDGTGFSPLQETLFYYQPDDVAIVETLLKSGATIEDEDIFSAVEMVPKVFDKSKTNGTVFSTSYDRSTAEGITDIVSLLLTSEKVNMKNGFGETLLIVSVQNENICLAEYLISVGADITITDNKGKTALDYALDANNQTLIDIFLVGQGETP